jgi:RND superfamily putative drug exporter
MADVGGLERADGTATLGELLEERLHLTQPWYRGVTIGRRTRRWIERINTALAETGSDVTLTAHTDLHTLPQRERAVALAAIALAEGTPVVMLDQLDTFASERDEAAFVDTVCRLARTTATVVIGTPMPARTGLASCGGRQLVTIDLDRSATLITKGVSS